MMSARPSPSPRAAGCCSLGKRPVRIAMKMMLSMPSTISMTVRATSAIACSAISMPGISGQILVGLIPARRDSPLQHPALPIFLVNELLGLGGVCHFEIRGVPLQRLARAIRDDPEHHRLGERSGIIEVAGGRAAGANGR